MRVRAVLVGAALALLAAACGGDDGSQVSTGGTAATATVTTATTGATAPGDASEGGGADGERVGAGASNAGDTEPRGPSPTAGTRPPGAGATGSAPSETRGAGGTEAGTPGTDPADPARPGTYRYDTEGESRTTGAVTETHPFPKVTTLTVDPPDGRRQRSVRDLRDESGDGGVITTVLLFRADGVYLERLRTETHASGLTFGYEFAPSPAQLVFPTGVKVGDHLEFTLTSTDGGITAEVTIDVLGEETLTVGGRSVRTLLVRTHTLFRGDFEGASTSRTNLSPEHSLVVREDVVSEARFGISRSRTEYRASLQSLSPS